ncbi:ribosome biogenesis protein NOP53-like [Teleopsis dalmanni]|uniref:ribosome biogenesis protein NOP53-like n=1 Tax=Teleopsis dalmanni TaxID=139649 RepID=UPI0018CF56A2|nr:ribosome biogenesis protein NOP53-like [Teleopsis dalmanni]
MSVAKRKRISKKNKSAWRKTDIKDVEDYLEVQRQEERVGTVADKPDEELFILDGESVAQKRSALTEKQKRKVNAKKPLRSLNALINTSKVQDPIVKRNRVKLKKSGRIIEEEVRNPTKPRHFQANKDRARYHETLEKKNNKKSREIDTSKDIWAVEDFRDKIPGLKDEKGWISRELALHVTNNIGKPVIKVHESIRHRTTKAKNFEPPHPGTSYNPSLEDHQDLLANVVQTETKIIKKEEHMKRITTKMFSKVTPEERDQLRLKEMRAGLDDEDEGNNTNDETNDADTPYTTLNAPVENKKKSKQARRKELKQKELQKKHQERKALKKQVADLNRIKSIKAEVLAESEALNQMKKHRKKVAEQKKFEPKRLGRLKYVEPDVDVNMAEDIAGNLRNIKTESSLLVDRFKNFQKRNILPTSVATGKQKAKKVKRFPRASHKEAGISHQMLRDQKKSGTLKFIK